MPLLGTVRVGNYTNLDRTDTVTAVLSLPATAIRLRNDLGQETDFELSAVGAVTGSTVRVQWHTFGRPSICPDQHPLGQIPYRKYLRVMFLCDIPANSTKQVSIYLNENQATPTPFVLNTYLRESIRKAGIYIDLAGFHGTNWKFPDTGPSGKCRICFDLSDFANGATANIIDTWKDPNNAVVRRWRFRSRGFNPDPAGDNAFAYQWWGELDIEIGTNQRTAKCYLRYGPSIIQRDGAIHSWRNPNVMLFSMMPHLYNEGTEDVFDTSQTPPVFVGRRTAGGMAPAEHGIFMTVTGPKSSIYMSFCKVDSSVTQTVNPFNPNLYNVKYRLLNPNQSKTWGSMYAYEAYANIYGFSNGQQQIVRFVLSDTQDASATELNTITSLEEDKTWTISEDWVANQNYGVLGFVPPNPFNTQAEARTACQQMDDDHYALYVLDRQRIGSMPWGGAQQFCGHNGTNYCSKANQGAGGAQGDFCLTAKLWPWAAATHPRLRAAQFCVDMDNQRATYFRYESVLPFRNINHRVNDPQRYTDVFMWNGRPHQNPSSPGVRRPPDCDLFGLVGEIGEYETGGALSGFSKEHISLMSSIYFVLLTGDWLTLQVCRDLEEVVFASFQLASYGGLRSEGIDNPTNDRSIGRSITCMLSLYDLLFENNQQNQAAEWWTVPSYKLYRAAILRYQAYVGSLPVFRTDYYILNSQPENEQDCRHSVTACNPGNRPQFTAWMAPMLTTAELYIQKVVGTNPVFNLAKHEEMTRAISVQYWVILYQNVHFVCRMRDDCCLLPVVPPCFVDNTINGGPAGFAYMPYYISLQVPGRAFGAEVLPTDYADCSNITIESQIEYWCMGAFVLGWDIAVKNNDVAFQQRCKALIDARLDGLTLATRDRGQYGFGRYPVNNADEWTCIVPDLYKNREDGSAPVRANFMGTSTINVTIDSLGGSEFALAAAFTGTGELRPTMTVNISDIIIPGLGGKYRITSELVPGLPYLPGKTIGGITNPGVGSDGRTRPRDGIVTGDSNNYNMPNYSGKLKIVDTENLIKETTLLINYVIQTTGEWVYSTYDCGYKPVCDEYWYVMHPNHQHPRHTDASPVRPFYVLTGGAYGTFAWNYGGIPGISPVDFDDQHSFLVQLAMVNQGCFHTGGQSGTGQTGGSSGSYTGYTGVSGLKPPEWPKGPGDIKKPGYGAPPYPGTPDWPQMPGTGELITIIQLPPSVGIGYTETTSPNKPINSIEIGRTDPIKTIGSVRDSIIEKGTITSSLIPGLTVGPVIKSVLTEALSPKPPSNKGIIITENPINDKPGAWGPINGDKGFSNKEIDNNWNLGGKGNNNPPLAESPKDLFRDAASVSSYIVINRSVDLAPGDIIDSNINIPTLQTISNDNSNKVVTNELPAGLETRSEREGTYTSQTTRQNTAATSIELSDERITVEVITNTTQLRIGELLTIASNCIPTRDAEMFVYGKILIVDAANKQVEAHKGKLVKATHDKPAQLAISVRTDTLTAGPAYVTATYTDGYNVVVGVKTIRIDLVNKLSETSAIDSYRPIRHDVISDDLARTAGVSKDNYVDITLENYKALVFTTSNSRFGFVITPLEPLESDIKIDAELLATPPGDGIDPNIGFYNQGRIFEVLGDSLDYATGPIILGNKGALASDHLAGLITRDVPVNTLTLAVGRLNNVAKPIRLRIYINKEAKLRPVTQNSFTCLPDGSDWNCEFLVPYANEKFLLFERGRYSGEMPTTLTGVYRVSNVSGAVIFSVANSIALTPGNWVSIMTPPFNYGTDIIHTQEVP